MLGGNDAMAVRKALKAMDMRDMNPAYSDPLLW